jgi:L-ascorbate metabolism protein UlaG (beta-lactamase superfamily)
MEKLNDINWLGHASFFLEDKVSGNRVYYIDPFDLRDKKLPKGDLVFITHAHSDHLSLEDLKKILKDDTFLIAPSDCLDRVDVGKNRKFPVLPNKEYNVKNLNFQTIPAYNIKPERLSFHPKENNWVGYIITLNNKKIYHAGDTDYIPEMDSLKDLNLDIALLPMGGTYTMGVEETIKAANSIQALITIPIHYRRNLGKAYDQAEKKLKEEVKNSRVVILEEFE